MSTNTPSSGKFSTTAMVTTGFAAIGTAITIATGAYNLGKSNGTDSATAQCATASVTDKSELSKVTASLAIATERIKTLEQYNADWKKAYESSQQTVTTQASQIATLTVGAKHADVCEFFKSQVQQLQYRLDRWTMSEQERAQMTASKDAVIAKMEGCAKN
ncbi:hypothetical protein WJ99_13810 [Burkholderia ubonensis]|uniref:Lysozyme inhibitor LprI N-terminal domain-containing protein n=1 Tax=Burkholderia ubonensis TaxID=101571 RepID=A0AAW3MXQ8_9BURK|nr:hypothetical protein [Burkholderia ubonensis]KVQ12016.1 hypothetical protein WJ99_13810 [Burkholderia ubonensis]KVT40582.1 hypothetical protein WK53_20710 [Burkholderia ubonensis]KVW25868.1 hypothetical protein WK94_02035 [Burkholderia ubonensis]